MDRKEYTPARHIPPKVSHIPTFDEIDKEVQLGDGESVTGWFDTKAQVGQEIGTQGRLVNTFRLKDEKGSGFVLKGGKRLMNAMKAAVSPGSGTVRIRITATGAPNTLSRNYKA